MARPASTYRAARRNAWRNQRPRPLWRRIIWKRRATKRVMPTIVGMPPPRYEPYVAHEYLPKDERIKRRNERAAQRGVVRVMQAFFNTTSQQRRRQAR